MAERLQISTATLRRLERGDPSLSVGTLAKAFVVLNALEGFSSLLDTGADDLGLQFMDEALPKRIVRKSSRRGPEGENGSLYSNNASLPWRTNLHHWRRT